MVRVGGGWDTLEHFLSRHGADDAPQISPSDLLPTDTRPQPTEPRTKGSPTSETNGTSPNSSPNKTFSRSPSMSQLPPLRRAVSITPVSVSRRSSTSSPEPWTGNLSSGDSGCGSCDRGVTTPRREGQLLVVSTKKRTPRRSSLCGPSPSLQRQLSSQSVAGDGGGGRVPLSIRRSLITESGGKLKPIHRSTLGLNSNATNGHELKNAASKSSNKDLSSTSQSPSSGKTTTATPTLSSPGTKSMIPTPKRYINYLSSSQHIKPPTAKSSPSSPLISNSSTPLIKGGSSSSLIPALISDHSFNENDHSEDGKNDQLNNKNRRSSLKAF